MSRSTRVTTSTCRAPVVTHSSSSLVPPAGGPSLALRPIFVSLDREDPGLDAVARAPTASRNTGVYLCEGAPFQVHSRELVRLSNEVPSR